MIHNLKIIWFFFLLLLSCNKEKRNKDSLIPLDIEANIKNLKQINLSQFTDNIKYVVLEFKESLPFSWIAKIDLSEKLIIVSDMKTCLLYDSEGHFISKIGAQGRGPGEYEFVSNIGFLKNKMVSIQSIFDLMEYNLDGSFIKKYKNGFMIENNENTYLSKWLIIDDSLYFGHVPNTTGQIAYKAMIINKNGDVKHEYKNYLLCKRERPVASDYEDFAHIYRFNGSIFYNELFNDTLFSLNEKHEFIAKYFFNLGKLKMPASDRVKYPSGKIMANYIFIWEIFQTEKYLLFKCDFGNRFPAKRLTPITVIAGTEPAWYNTRYVLGLYYKNTGELIFCKPSNTDNPLFTSGIYNDIDAGPRFFPTKQVNDSTLVMWVTAEKLKAHVASEDFKKSVPKFPEKKKRLEDLANSLNDLDNPVLMFVTI